MNYNPKKGDKVICISPTGTNLEYYKIYIIHDIVKNYIVIDGFLKPNGDPYLFTISRFIPIDKTKRTNKYNYLKLENFGIF